MTSTNGLSSSPRAAARNGARNSSPPSVGERTLLCRLTFGSPGIAPRRTSSMPGCPAAVIETVSPSQLIPSEIQRMCTSSTPAACGSLAVAAIALPSSRHELVVDFDRLDEQLLTTDQLHVNRPAARAHEREPVVLAGRAAARAAADRGHRLDPQLRAFQRRSLRNHLEREPERGGTDLPHRADAHVDRAHAAPGGVPRGHRHHRLGYRQLVQRRPPQQILGSGSPTSWSITRFPPKLVSTSTIDGGSVFTSPISAACSQPGTARTAASAASAASGSTKATSLPSFATYIGSIPSSSQ